MRISYLETQLGKARIIDTSTIDKSRSPSEPVTIRT